MYLNLLKFIVYFLIKIIKNHCYTCSNLSTPYSTFKLHFAF